MPPCKRMSEKLPDIRVLESGTGDRTVKFEPGDHVFGWLDSQPIVFTPDMKLGQHLAVSYDNIREHRKATDF